MPNNTQTIPITPSEQRVLSVIKNELFPKIERIKKLMVEIQACRVTYQLRSKELNKLEKTYAVVSKEFFEVVRKLETLDILFEGMNDADANVVAYFKYKQGFAQTISEGVGYIEIIDRALDRKLGQINNNRTLIIALIALLWQIAWPINIGNRCFGAMYSGEKLVRRDCTFIVKVGTIIDANWDTSYQIK